MSITIELEPDLEARLAETAARKGQSAAEFLHELAQQFAPPVAPRLSKEEWLSLLYQMPPTAADAPEIPAEALRRENIYEDRV